MNEPNEYSECYVAFLDILGFKNIVNQYSSQKLKNVYDEIRKRVVLLKAGLYEFFIPEETVERMNIIIMSDSIIISAQKDDVDALYAIILLVATTQYYLLENGILLRGGISKGLFYHFDEVTFGPALVQAYNLENDKAIYPRVIFDGDFSDDLMIMETKSTGSKTFICDDDDGVKFVDSLKFHLISQFSKFEEICLGITTILKVNIDFYTNDTNVLLKYQWLKKHYEKTLDFFVAIKGRSVIECIKAKS